MSKALAAVILQGFPQNVFNSQKTLNRKTCYFKAQGEKKNSTLLTLRAVGPYPAWEALTRSIHRIARPVLGALAHLSTVLPVFSTGADWENIRLFTEGSS